MYPRDWITLGGVIATLLVSVVAIFGDKIRASWFKPKLCVHLDSPRGVFVSEIITPLPPAQQYMRPARYYYLSVGTTRRWPLAHDVRILVTRLETPDPGGVPRTVWTGEIPLRWEHPEIQPASRTLGRPARADFIAAAQDQEEVPERRNQLHLMSVNWPSNMQRVYFTGTRFWVTVVATSNEADSSAIRLEIAWDGNWNPGEAEMWEHLKIRPASS
jgi:hypothetical protein